MKGEVTGGEGRDFGPSECWKQIDAAAHHFIAAIVLLFSTWRLWLRGFTVVNNDFYGVIYIHTHGYSYITLVCIILQKVERHIP